MAKIASSKQTGQGGTTFEDKTVAYFLACLLAEHLPFGTEQGLITSFSLQTRPQGWLFDDTLLEFNGQSRLVRVAVSTKSNRQFTSNGCPPDINHMLWEQFLLAQFDHDGINIDNPFCKETDYLCLVHAPISEATTHALDQLIQEAVHTDPVTLHARVYSGRVDSNLKKKIYQSFFCPEDLAKQFSIRPEDTGKLLKVFLHQAYDFEKLTSRDEAAAIALCKTLLTERDQQQAQGLFEKLRLLPRQLAPIGGSMNRQDLVRLLRDWFSLAQAPAYHGDWKKIEQARKEKFAAIEQAASKQFTLNRKECLQQLDKLLNEAPIVVIQGISGSGKSSLAKQYAETKLSSFPVIWMDSGDLESGGVEKEWQLPHLLTELMAQVSSYAAYLFIDSVEKLYDDTKFQKILTLLHTALTEGSPWKLVFTCTTDQLEQFKQRMLPRKEPAARDFSIPPLSTEQVV